MAASGNKQNKALKKSDSEMSVHVVVSPTTVPTPLQDQVLIDRFSEQEITSNADGSLTYRHTRELTFQPLNEEMPNIHLTPHTNLANSTVNTIMDTIRGSLPFANTDTQWDIGKLVGAIMTALLTLSGGVY